MADINQEIEQIVAEMREVGKQAAPCKGGNFNNLLRYKELRERILSKFLEVFDTGGRLEMPTLTPPNEPLTWEELKAETKINPVYSVKYGWILPITVMDGQPYAQIWFFTSKGFAQTELFYHDTFYRRPPEGKEEMKDDHMG